MMLMYNVVAQTGDIDKEEVDSSLRGIYALQLIGIAGKEVFDK